MPEYPPELTITPLAQPPRATLRPPGSKSLTNRALIVAALADGKSTLTGALDSDDTRVMVEALRSLGLKVEHDAASATIAIDGCRGKIPARSADLFVGNSGTSLRFLTAMVATGRGEYRLDGTPRMRERPAADLLATLNALGANATSELGTGCPPVTVRGDMMRGGYAFVRGDVSSQFLSALLMAAPYSTGFTAIEVEGPLVSRPYVAMTLEVMEAFGVRIGNHGFKRFNVDPAQYQGRPYAIEPDASAASYWFAAAAIAGGTVTVEGLGTASVQGDMGFVDVLEHMGCTVERTKTSTTVTGPETLRALDVDMNAISDTVMTLAVVALFAEGMTRIRNVGHIRHKETDRIAAVAAELRKLGATVHERPDGLIIFPPDRITPARIATYDDHRMAMAFALVGLKAEGVTILEPACVAKTYPGFWDDLAATPGRTLRWAIRDEFVRTPVGQLLTHGASGLGVEWPDYPSLYGLTAEHVPELLRMASDESLYEPEVEPEGWATVHARRALGQLGAIETIPGLLAAMDKFGDVDDFWTEELAVIFARMGPGAIPELARHLTIKSHDEFTRLECASGMEEIARAHPETRDEVVAILTAQLAKFEDDDAAWIVNANLVSSLLELKATESAAVIEAAFKADVVDQSVCGGWATARYELGLGPKPAGHDIHPEWRLPFAFRPPAPKRPDPKMLLKKAKSRKRR